MDGLELSILCEAFIQNHLFEDRRGGHVAGTRIGTLHETFIQNDLCGTLA